MLQFSSQGGVSLVPGGVSAWSKGGFSLVRGGVCLVRGGSPWSGGVLLGQGGFSLPGGSAWSGGGSPWSRGGSPCPGGSAWSWGDSPWSRGGLSGLGGSPWSGGVLQTPPVYRITDTCKNITLATTSLWPVTRMHSSRMRTARGISRPRGGLPQYMLEYTTPPGVGLETPLATCKACWDTTPPPWTDRHL